MKFKSADLLWEEVERRLPGGGIIGISGFGGSGKTQLAIDLARYNNRDKPGIQLVHVDDYLDWQAVQQRNSGWGGVDYASIRSAHILPFKTGKKPVNYLIVEGIRIFTEDSESDFDLKIWVDTDMDKAVELGKSRDGANQELWEIFEQNERDFEAKHDPRSKADILYQWQNKEGK